MLAKCQKGFDKVEKSTEALETYSKSVQLNKKTAGATDDLNSNKIKSS